MKILSVLLFSISLYLAGCSTGQQRTAANSLSALHDVTQATVDNYFLAAYKGIAPTNGIPQVSSAYGKFQLAYLVALDAVQFNTNALASASLQVESSDVINLVGLFYKGGK